MKVTKVWVTKRQSGKLLGFADVTFSLDDTEAEHVVWKGFRLFQGEGQVEIGLPSKKSEKPGENTFYPVIILKKEEDGSGPVCNFYEYIRSEVEKAFLSVPDLRSNTQQNNTQQNTQSSGPSDFSDDVPF